MTASPSTADASPPPPPLPDRPVPSPDLLTEAVEADPGAGSVLPKRDGFQLAAARTARL